MVQRGHTRFFNLLAWIWERLGTTDFRRSLHTGLLLASLVILVGSLIIYLLWSDLPDLSQLRQYQPRLATRILDRNGETLTEFYTQRRLMTPLDRIPLHTIDAVLTTEDRRFYRHWGVDVVRIFRAAIVNISTLSIRQGASTITQQLARDLFLHKRQTFTRKIREVITAIQIERHYAKPEILEMYLTQIYFGHGAYGIAAAAQNYFGKHVEDLTLSESALLAALPKAPSRYSPRFRPERALNRRNLVLHSMLNVGVITQEEYHTAANEPIQVIPGGEWDYYGNAPYFTEMVRQQLSSEGSRLGFDHLEDGLEVSTTIDNRLQFVAERAVKDHLSHFQTEYRIRFIERNFSEICNALDYEYNAKTTSKHVSYQQVVNSLLEDSTKIDSIFWRRAVAQVALIALDPSNGDILALIGGKDFSRWKFNRAIQAIRQPGSVFKPIAFTAAIDNGYPTTFELLNQDVVLINPDGTRWTPSNYDGSKGGLTTLREAMRLSLNLVAVRLVQEVVPPRMVVNYAKQLGFSTPIAAVDAIALGATGVIPLEAASAFAVFASGGIYNYPRSITEIRDRYNEQVAFYPVKQRVALSPETSYIITSLLMTAIDRGTGGSARWKYNFRITAAGKTGTTNDFTDAWFIGYTPKLVCAVWVGVDDPSESLGKGQSGSVAALPIWAEFMKAAYDTLRLEDEPFPKPAGIVELTICNETKDIATVYCPLTSDEVFRQDAKPSKQCRKHTRVIR